MRLILRACTIELVSDSDESVRWKTPWLEVMEEDGKKSKFRWRDCLEKYSVMCDALMTDVRSMNCGGKHALARVREVEGGKLVDTDFNGNAWIAHLNLNSVWFEGMYGQDEEGRVTFPQYKLALQTFVNFLSDSDRKPIEVEFPGTWSIPYRAAI